MCAAVRERFDAHPDPSPEAVPIGPGQLDRIDDNLHFGWSWHRHRYVYRRGDGLRILDAGCGTGLSTLGLARLNPGSEVIGLDISPRSLEIARQRAGAGGGLLGEFREHDLAVPLPAGLGPFDFIVCRGVLGLADDPAQILKNLARVLDDRGLLLATFPTRPGLLPVRQFRRAVDALAGPDASLDERARLGVELFHALRPDHPIKMFEAQTQGHASPGPERIIAGYLADPGRDFTLEGAIALVEEAGLQFLYSPQRQPWAAEKVFHKADVSDALKTRVEARSERDRATLMDALDPTLHRDEYRVYACPADFEPRLPAWPEAVRREPEVLDRLVPHPTGLARPAGLSPDPAASRGAVSYRVVTGALGEIDWRSDALLRAADGQRSCGAIARDLQTLTGVAETPQSLAEIWLNLANFGFLMLESPDPRQHLDCRYLGPVRDRLNCPCPRLWVRACERHGLCTIDRVQPDDEQHAALQAALTRLDAGRVMACAACPDYDPEE